MDQLRWLDRLNATVPSRPLRGWAWTSTQASAYSDLHRTRPRYLIEPAHSKSRPLPAYATDPLHPPVHAHMIDSELLPVTVVHGAAQVPANCHDDHIRREQKPSKREPRQRYSTSATMHQLTLPEPLIPQRSSAPTGRLRNLGYS
jgi:hypothetical protein